MTIRVSAQPDFVVKAITGKRSGNLKRNAWLTIYVGCATVWAAAALSVCFIFG